MSRLKLLGFKNMLSSLVVLGLFFVQSCAGHNYTYTWTAPDLPTDTGYQSVSCGQDGTHCVAVEYYGQYNNYKTSQIYYSADGGASWKNSTNENAMFSNLYSSKTGQYVLTNDGHFSSDYGASFALLDNLPDGAFAVAMNEDATTLYVVANSAKYEVLKGVGKVPGKWTWTELSVPSSATATTTTTYRYISCDADGKTVILTDDSGSLYYSADSGTSWTESSTEVSEWEGYTFNRVVTSLEGDVSYVLVHYKPYGSTFPLISRDRGATWNSTGLGATTGGYNLATSADGSVLAIAWSNAEGVFVSYDYAQNFDLSEIPYTNGVGTVWVSPDGSKIVAAAYATQSYYGLWYLHIGTGVEQS